MRNPMYYGAMMVEAGDGDTLLTGADQYYPDALRPALQAIGPEEETPRVAGLYLMVFSDELYIVADATVNPDPTA
ncbi:MAG: phosphate acyltransferase, partial [Gemmatimonadota bacterium]